MSTAKLPVLATVRATYRSVKEHAGDLALFSRATAIAAAVGLALGYGLVQLAGADPDSRYQSAGQRVALMTSFALVIVSIGLFIIVVKWHRMIVRDMAPEATRRAAGRVGLLYFARSFLLGSVGGFVALVGGLLPVTLSRDLPIPPDVRPWFTIACVSVSVVAAAYVVGRFSLILPAGAVGDQDVTWRRSWAMTAGNGWRILAGSVLSSGPAVVVNIVFNGFVKALPNIVAASVPSLLAALILSLILTVITALIQASFLSYAYRFFTTREAAA